MDVGGSRATFNATDSPAQDYLFAVPLAAFVIRRILQWPQLTPFWETVEVLDVDDAKSMRSRSLGRYHPAGPA